MRATRLGVTTLILAVSMPLAAQNEFLLSEGLDGFHHSLVLADNPDTGDVLAVWAMRPAPDFDRVSIMARLLKHSNSGYKPQKLVEVASGTGSRTATLENARPDVTWAPGMKSYYAVWINGQDGSANEVRGRRLKRQNGKPKGGILTLADGGAFHDSPTIGAQLVNGKHDARFFYTQRTPGDATSHDFELVGQDVAKSGKPSGAALVERSFTGQALFVDAIFPIGVAPEARQAGFLTIRKCNAKIEFEQDDTGKCFLVLYKDGFEVDRAELEPCPEDKKATPGAVHLLQPLKPTDDGTAADGTQTRWSVNAECDSLVESRRVTWFLEPRFPFGEEDRLARFGGLYDRDRDRLPSHFADEDLYIAFRSDNSVWLARVDPNGEASASKAFTYDPDLVDIRAVEVPADGSGAAHPTRHSDVDRWRVR